MTEIMVDTAEEEFLKGRTVSAFKWATIAQELDPFFGSVNQYVEGYRTHIAALKKHTTGEIDWYGILAIQENERPSISCDSITHRYVKLAKLISPDVHCSAAAPRAFKLITTAWEVLGEPDKRRAYHARVGLPPPPPPPDSEQPPRKKRCGNILDRPGQTHRSAVRARSRSFIV